jgi:hypothetical protein
LATFRHSSIAFVIDADYRRWLRYASCRLHCVAAIRRHFRYDIAAFAFTFLLMRFLRRLSCRFSKRYFDVSFILLIDYRRLLITYFHAAIFSA